MSDTLAPPATARETTPTRVGVVSFVNTLPLIDGLDVLENIGLRPSVPSLLISQLLDREVDLALCSSIDYQMSPEPLVIVPAGLLGCDGPTLTVRLYARSPLDRLERIYCDTDSHTSVILMQVLLREVHGIDPELVEYDAREHVAENRPVEHPEAMLLIGDKVVTDSPQAVRYPTQLDLGELWRSHTGTPFVFAAWMARRDTPSARLMTAGRVLDRQRRRNRARIDRIIHRHAEPRGWPRDLAVDYLQRRLVYEYTPEREAALGLFFRKAYEHGLVERCRPIERLEL